MFKSFEILCRRLPEPARAAVMDAADSCTWIKVRRALSALDQRSVEDQGPEVAIQILSTFTLESIQPALCLGLRCIPCRPKLEFAPLNTIEQQLFDRGSEVYRRRCLASVVFWRVDELLPELYHPCSSGGPKELKRKAAELINRMEQMAAVYAEAGSHPLFYSTVMLPPSATGAMLEGQLGSGLSATIAEINARIFDLASRVGKLRVLDLNRWSAQEGEAHYDAQMDFMARQPFSIRGALSLGVFLARNLRPLLAPRRKVLAVDLDNTLWGGILGEDGVANLKLGQDFPGNIFLRLQREMLELKEQGVLLALVSKNQESDARKAIETMPGMLLKWQDFVCRKVNFDHKYVNLRQAADELGLGLNSFVFLDDSDYERAQMQSFNPEVLILNERGAPLHMLDSLLRTDAFDVHQLTQEDLARHREYQLRAARSVPSHQGNITEFLASLELRARLEPVNKNNIERVMQLLGKTNQFNLTTRRHRLEDLQSLLSRPGSVSLTLRLTDKFGDQGIVGVLLAVPGDDLKTWCVDSFLMSCRVIGRGVEDALWASLVNRAARSGVARIVGDYIPTPKNGLAATVYERLGLRRLEELQTGTRFVLETVQPIPLPAWMTVEDIDV
ncbi:MAG: HAD-IIIC family phosphatase [Verrucomicrobiota bacterium]|jgi:FkbH-like protein